MCVSYDGIIRRALCPKNLNMKLLIQFLPESNSLLCTEDSKYICAILSIYNFFSLPMSLLYQPSTSFKISDYLISPISGTSIRLLHSAGAVALVRGHMDCNHAVLLSNSNLTFLSMKGDEF